jgi:hypothetical protein
MGKFFHHLLFVNKLVFKEIVQPYVWRLRWHTPCNHIRGANCGSVFVAYYTLIVQFSSTQLCNRFIKFTFRNFLTNLVECVMEHLKWLVGHWRLPISQYWTSWACFQISLSLKDLYYTIRILLCLAVVSVVHKPHKRPIVLLYFFK